LVIHKKILITAGPTWVALDKARVISNIATGETGFTLAHKFKKAGFEVTLLLGPGNFCGSYSGIKIMRFKYFSELAQLLKKELKTKRYYAVIHAAAVADYQPKKVIPGKIDSHLKFLRIDLVPAKKLINDFRKDNPDLFSVGFKFEPNADSRGILTKGRALLKQADLNLVVANSFKNKIYRAYILGQGHKYGPFLSKTKMASGLVKLLGKN